MISDPPDGQMPALTPEAVQRAAAVRAARRGGDGYYNGPFDGPEDLTLYVRCITRGLPGSMMPAIYGNSYQIVQGPGWVAIRYEMVHETRFIPLDGRPHASGKLHSYMGDARGHWEGDTLVVETTNFLEKSAFGGASDQLKTTERFKPLGKGVARLVDYVRRCTDVGSSVDVRDAADARRVAADLRVRVPRRQRRNAGHPDRGSASRTKRRSSTATRTDEVFHAEAKRGDRGLVSVVGGCRGAAAGERLVDPAQDGLGQSRPVRHLAQHGHGRCAVRTARRTGTRTN